MKKTKILMPIVTAATAVATIAPALALSSCSSNSNYNQPELSKTTPKVRKVSADSTRIYFVIAQKNLKQPEATKAKITNLVVNGTSATPVDGIIKTNVDSGGNVRVTFNMSVVQKHYQAESITFDLILTNAKANTEYTLTGFQVEVSEAAGSIEYNSQGDGIQLEEAPTSIEEGQDLDISFSITDETKYELKEEDCDVIVNGVSIKEHVTFDFTTNPKTIHIPAEYLGSNPSIEIRIVTVAITAVTSVTLKGDQNVDISNSNTFTAVNQNQEDITAGCTFSIEDSLGYFDGNELILSETAKKQGGSGNVTVTHTKSGNHASFEVEIATFSKFNQKTMLKDGIITPGSSCTGLLVMPTRYFDGDGNSTEQKTIGSSFESCRDITDLFIPKTINSIQASSRAFWASCGTIKTIVIDSANETYCCPTDSNCIITKGDKTLIVGCSNTMIPDNPNVVDTIGKYALMSFGKESITIPSNITTIMPLAFFKWGGSTSTLKSVTFADTSNRWVDMTDAYKYQLDISNPTNNATYLMNRKGTGYEWGYTGIKVNNSAIKQAKINYQDVASTYGLTFGEQDPTTINESTSTQTVTFNITAPDPSTSGVFTLETLSSDTVVGTSSFVNVLNSSTQVTIDIAADKWASILPQDTLILKFAETKLTVEGERNVDVNSSSSLTYVVKDPTGTPITPTTISTSDTSLATISSAGALTITDKGKKQGGSVTISASYTYSSNNYVVEYGIELGTFDKLLTDGSGNSLQKGKAWQKDTSVDGLIVIPGRYFNSGLTTFNKWVPTQILGDFSNATITSIFVGKNISSMSFFNTYSKNITEIKVSDDPDAKSTSRDSNNVEHNCVINKSTHTLLLGCKTATIPNDGTVTIIGPNSFASKEITSVTIPACVTEIKDRAFESCSQLTTLDFEANSKCTTFGYQSFGWLKSLQTFTVPDSVTSIGKQCFINTDAGGLTSITLPNSKWIQTGVTPKTQLNVSNASTNATNLRNYESTASNNWGYTGISVDSEAFKTATVTYDATSFSGINVSEYTSSVQQGSTEKITIAGTATTSMSGKIIVKNSASATIATLDNVTFDTESKSYEIDLSTLWDSISAQDTLTLTFATAVTRYITSFTQGTTGMDYESDLFDGITSESPIKTFTVNNTIPVVRNVTFTLTGDTTGKAVVVSKQFAKSEYGVQITVDLTEIFEAMAAAGITQETVTVDDSEG